MASPYDDEPDDGCGADWEDPARLPHFCALEDGHLEPHECICGATLELTRPTLEPEGWTLEPGGRL